MEIRRVGITKRNVIISINVCNLNIIFFNAVECVADSINVSNFADDSYWVTVNVIEWN